MQHKQWLREEGGACSLPEVGGGVRCPSHSDGGRSESATISEKRHAFFERVQALFVLFDQETWMQVRLSVGTFCILSHAPLEGHPLAARREPSALEGWILEVLYCAATKRRGCRFNPRHPTPYTLRLTPNTLHPTPNTLHPTPYTLHPTPNTQHPTPYTQHPAPNT